MGRHLVFTRCRKMSSDVDLPSLPNNAVQSAPSTDQEMKSLEKLDALLQKKRNVATYSK